MKAAKVRNAKPKMIPLRKILRIKPSEENKEEESCEDKQEEGCDKSEFAAEEETAKRSLPKRI